jgi:hypothetical protein
MRRAASLETKWADAHHASPRFIAGANSVSPIRMAAASSESVSPQHLGAQIPIAEHAAPPTARASRGFVLWRFSYAGRRRLRHDWRAAGRRSGEHVPLSTFATAQWTKPPYAT